ncbi:unnamed protein product, partial [Scytosiphon promiscuus]
RDPPLTAPTDPPGSPTGPYQPVYSPRRIATRDMYFRIPADERTKLNPSHTYLYRRQGYIGLRPHVGGHARPRRRHLFSLTAASARYPSLSLPLLRQRGAAALLSICCRTK